MDEAEVKRACVNDSITRMTDEVGVSRITCVHTDSGVDRNCTPSECVNDVVTFTWPAQLLPELLLPPPEPSPSLASVPMLVLLPPVPMRMLPLLPVRLLLPEHQPPVRRPYGCSNVGVASVRPSPVLRLVQ